MDDVTTKKLKPYAAQMRADQKATYLSIFRVTSLVAGQILFLIPTS